MATPETATFAIALEDKSSGAADSAADALQNLRDEINGDMKALREMQGAMKRLKASTTPNLAAIKELSDKIAAQKAKVAENEAAFVSLGGRYGKLKREKPAAFFEQIAAAAGRSQSPIGGVVLQMESLKSAIAGGLMAAGLVAVAAGILAIGAASIAATAALTSYGIAQADAARSELMRLEALTKLRRFQGQAAGNAAELQGAIDRVADSTALGRDKLEEYTGQLYRMGVRGANLDAALEGMAIRGAVLGDRYAAGFAAMAAGAARAGRDVRTLTENVRARLGGVAERQLLSLDVQSRRLRQNFSALFGGLKIEGFLKALKGVADLFSQSTASGRAIKQILEVMFQPLIDGSDTAGPVVKRFFQGMIIAAQEFTIAILRVRVWLKKTFGDSENLAQFDAQRAAVVAGMVAFGLFALAVGAASAALVLFMAALVAPFAIIFALGYALAWAVDHGLSALSSALGDWRDMGARLVDGLVGGIRSAAKRVGEAVRGLASDARSALANALQIRSPSRVFASLGVQIPRGLEAGVEMGTPGVERAVDRMVSVPADAVAGDASTGGAAGRIGAASPSVSISFGDIHWTAKSDDAQQEARDFVDSLVLALRGAGIGMGAPT